MMSSGINADYKWDVPAVFGAVVGDIIASPYRLVNTDRYDFPLFEKNKSTSGHVFHPGITGVSVITAAVSKWLMTDSELTPKALDRLIIEMIRDDMDRNYTSWLFHWIDLQSNGEKCNFDLNFAAAIVSPIGMCRIPLKDAIDTAGKAASVITSDKNTVRGAKAIAEAVWLASNGRSKEDILFSMEHGYGYSLSLPLEEITARARGYLKEPIIVNGEETGEYYFRDIGRREFRTGPTVTAALKAFMDGNGFEDTVRRAVVIGGDSCSIASIAGAIAGAKYGIPDEIRGEAWKLIPGHLDHLLYQHQKEHLQRESLLVRSQTNGHGAFKVIRFSDGRRVFSVPTDRKDIIDAIRQRFGKDAEIIRPGKEKRLLGKDTPKTRKGAYLETPRPEVRTLFYQEDEFRSITTAAGVTATPIAERREAFESFRRLKEYAQQVKTELQQAAGYYGNKSVHFESAYFPEIFHDRIEVWKGDLYAGSVGIDSMTGLISIDQGGNFGPMEWDGERTESVFRDCDRMTVRECIGHYCLDEGVGLFTKSGLTNIERANGDIARSNDKALLQAVEIGNRRTIGH